MKPTPSLQDQDIFELLEALKSVRVEYPSELLAKRRTAYKVQLALMDRFSVKTFHSLENEKIIEILENLQPVQTEYPSILMAKQRTAFLDKAAKRRKVGWMRAFLSTFQGKFTSVPRVPTAPITNVIYRSLVIVSIIVAAFAGTLIFGNREQVSEVADIPPTQREISQPIPVDPTATLETKKTSCTPGSTSSQCSTYGFNKSPDQASWISYSTNNWIKIDTGQDATINMVELDREFAGITTGEFTISVALSDGQYKQVYDSKSDNSTGTASAPGTVQASFDPVLARFVIVTVSDPGTAINGVRAFAVLPPPSATAPPQPTTTSGGISVPTRTQVAVPTNTALPTRTLTSIPTNTPLPSATPTARPTNTPVPTNTPLPTATSVPSSTAVPTATPVPPSTAMPTATSVPPNTPLPVNTPVPSNTPVPTIPP